VFFGLKHDQNSIQNRQGVLFFIVLNQSFGPLFSAVLLFHEEKPLFIRERASRTYRVLPYYLSRSLAETPWQLLFPIIFGCIVYWMIQLNPGADKFFFFLLVLITHFFTAQGIGLILSASTPSVAIAQAIAPVIVILLMLFGGFYLNSADLWPGIKWIQYISFITYAYRAICINEFSGFLFIFIIIFIYNTLHERKWRPF
jgi:ATP-binding cassette subfamily G (WHITE) protein 2